MLPPPPKPSPQRLLTNAVSSTASPFTFAVDDIQRDLLDPAVNGTNSILFAVHAHAPTVKRIVITSSFASIADPELGDRPGYTYSEKDWNPITHEQALQNTNYGYRASKTFAEKAAWEFVEKNKPNFDIATICPPMVLGPVKPYSPGIEAMNTSNTLISSIVTGQCKGGLGPAGIYCWVDVRDVALAHVRAMEKPEAGGKRFYLVEGPMSTQTIADVVAKNFPEYKDRLPEGRVPNDGFPEGGVHDNDNSRSKAELGIEYTPLEKSVTDFINSIKVFGV